MYSVCQVEYADLLESADVEAKGAEVYTCFFDRLVGPQAERICR